MIQNAQPNQIKVLIADDHAVVRQGLKEILSKTPDLVVVEEADNGNDVLEKVGSGEVDVVLVDIEMPEKSGWDVLLEMKRSRPKIPVIILSIYSEEQMGIRFLKAGASGYLPKNSAPEQLVEAIRRVFQGGKFISPGLAEKLVFNLNKDFEKLPHEMLSGREFQVFCMVASGKPLKTIADVLSISVTTVSTHRARILEKMDLNNNAELTLYASKHGLIR